MSRRRLVLTCSSDGKFAPHAGVMLMSAVAHTPDADIHIYYLHDPAFPEPTKAELRRNVAADPRVTLDFVEVPDALVEGLPLFRHQKPGSMPAVMWYRVFLPQLVPQESRILYLDCDLIVLDDLSPLWDADVSGHPLAAVSNPFDQHPRHRKIRELPGRLGLPGPEFYFNSGVMLLNLEWFRQHDLTRRLVEHGRAHADITLFADQDSLCALLYRERLPVPPRWNLMGTILVSTSSRQIFRGEELREAFERPAIVHFEGPDKPWHDPRFHPYGRRYQRFARRTPWPVPRKPVAMKDLENVLIRKQWLWLHRQYKRARRVLTRLGLLQAAA